MIDPFAPKFYSLIQNNNGPKLLSGDIGLNFIMSEYTLRVVCVVGGCMGASS